MTKKPIILTFIDWYLPGYKAGGPVRSLANLTAHLRDHFHFRIVTTDTDYLDQTPYPQIVSNKWTTRTAGEDVMYLPGKNLRIPTFQQIFRDTACDLVYINGIYSPWFSILPAWLAKRANKPVLIAPRGMLSGQAFSAKSAKKKLFLRGAQLAGLYRHARFHATLDTELSDIQKRLNIPKAHIFTAPNLFRKRYATPRPGKQKQPGVLKLVSIARISPEKNTLFAIQSLRGLSEGEITLELFGGIYDAEYWQKCLKAIQELPANVKVKHRGAVQGEQIPELLSRYDLLFLPSTGENFGHSILEALMNGVPVLISDKTPWQNLAAQNAGWALPLHDQDAFREKIRYAATLDEPDFRVWREGAKRVAQDFTQNQNVIDTTRRMFYASMRQNV